MPTDPQLGERLAQARKQANLSQNGVASLLGINPIQVSRWETGRSAPRASRRAQLCRLYKVDYDALFPPANGHDVAA